MALSDNRAKIQALIDGINALPQAGSGGGGGLPDGILAIASGTITPSSDITSAYTITHDLGTKPDFAALILCDDAGTSLLTGTKVFQFQAYKRVQISNGNVYTTRGHEMYLDDTGGFTPFNFIDTKDSYSTTSTVQINAGSNRPMKAGYTYRWVCGVLSDIQ